MKYGDALIVIDMQSDFVSENGSLYVSGAEKLIDPINDLMRKYDFVVLTQDFHPHGHISFASRWNLEPFTSIDIPGTPDEPFISSFAGPVPTFKQELWPVHCVAGSWGADFVDGLKTNLANLIIRKGMNKDREQYSAFYKTGLSAFLQDIYATEIDIVGVAFDYCVLNSALDARKQLDPYIHTIRVVKDYYSASVFPQNDDETIDKLRNAGIEVI